jgi:hypothetical protein
MPENIAALVRRRLNVLAREQGDVVERVFLRYAIERLLYRLSLSAHRDVFVLKGAMLFSLWAPVPYRSTGDLDLLGQGDPAPDRMVTIFRTVCTVAVDDDGLVFDPESVRAEPTREEEDYQGARITLRAMLGTARLALQVDIGFGDAVTPEATDIVYPSVLDFPAASLRAYPPETVVAEKLEAAVSLGMLNSRMKDFFDLWVIAKSFPFDGVVLANAVASTFARRGTALPTDLPVALTPTFSGDALKQNQWRAFLQRTTLAIAPEPLPELVAFIATFAKPLLGEQAGSAGWQWQPGGPWRPADAI